jgi:hypothetical protein
LATDPSIVAVLTGDLIESSRMRGGSLERARGVMRRTTGDFRSDKSGPLVGKLEFFRGDAWQLLLDPPGSALRVALTLRADLRWKAGADTRIAIGIGTTEKIDRRKVSLSSGEAFELSGHALDAMTGFFSLTAALPERSTPAAHWLPVITHLCSELVLGWTARQAEIVAHALRHRDATHEDIGAMLARPVKKQTVTSALRSAHFRALSEGLDLFEDTDWNDLLRPLGHGNLRTA